QELLEKKQRGENFSDQDLRDVQVWWSLAWIDQDLRPRELVEKGREFTEPDKLYVRELVDKTINQVIPVYREVQQAGSIEISTTPFYHPILPILINSRVDDPNVPVDVRVPEDAREQLVRAREFMKDRFGAYPQGLWPSEGSVSDEVAQLVAATGF